MTSGVVIGSTQMAIFIMYIVLGIAIPLLLAMIWKVKTKEPVLPMVIGAVIFFVFAIILESIPKIFLYQYPSSLQRAVMKNAWVYMGTAALLAGLFEETGRWIAFRFLLRKYKGKKTAITYGIGHGGFEMIYIFAMGGIQNLLYAAMIQAGQFETVLETVKAASPEQAQQLASIPEALAGVTLGTVVLALWERASAILIHIACSMVVFAGARTKGKVWLYPVAILLHGSIDIFAAMYQNGMISSTVLLEVLVTVWAVVLFTVVYKVIYKKMEN